MDTKNSKMQYSIVIVIIMLLSAGFVYYFSGTTSPVIPDYYGDDSAVFQVVGKAWSNGRVPYIQTFDHKGPFIFFVEALGYLIGKYGVLLMQWIFMCVNFLGIFKIGRLFLRYSSAVIATVVSFLILIPSYSFGNYTEEYSLLFITFSIYLGVKYLLQLNWNKKETLFHPWKYAVWYGIAFTVILFMRVTSAIAIACLVFVVLCILLRFGIWKNLLENIGGFLFGVSIVFVPFSVYFFVNGAWYDMIYGTIIHNIMYASKSSIFTQMGAPWRSVLIALFTTAVLFVVSILYWIYERRNNWILGAYGTFVSIVTMGLFFSINRYLHYYLISVPYFVLALGMTAKMRECVKDKIYKKILLYCCYLLLIVQVALGIERGKRQEYSNEIFRGYAKSYKSCEEQLMAHIPANEKNDFLAFGSNALSQWYLLANVDPSYRFCFVQSWMASCSDKLKMEISEYLNDKPAKWIVVDVDYDTEEIATEYCPEFAHIIQKRYELIDTEKMQDNRVCFQLYQLVE